MNIVEVHNLTSGYEDRSVLHNISMTAKKSAVTAILGISGCGKTTLLKNLIRLKEPESGSIRLFGQEITILDEPEFNKLLLRTGVLFQNGALLNSISISENVAIPLKQHTKLPDEIIRRLVQVKLDLFEMGHSLNLLPSQLSGGMHKRAALARSIILDPELLFCDEPSAGLDPVTSAALDELLLKLKVQLGMSVIVISHVVSSIKRIADSVIFLDKGKIIFSGSIHEAETCSIEKVEDFLSKA